LDLLEILIIAFGLSLDAFAVSLGISSSGRATAQSDSIRLSFHFGLFQSLMPIVGWLAGSTVEPLIAQFDHWVAFGLIAFVGFRMVKSGLSNEPLLNAANPTRGKTLVVLSLATSIDALVIGFSLAFLRTDVVFPSIVIGLVTFVVSYGGMRAGKWLSSRYGPKLEIVGGVVLLVIGAEVLASHLM
jgi:putative Mn2+ efflux pump MntP